MISTGDEEKPANSSYAHPLRVFAKNSIAEVANEVVEAFEVHKRPPVIPAS